MRLHLFPLIIVERATDAAAILDVRRERNTTVRYEVPTNCRAQFRFERDSLDLWVTVQTGDGYDFEVHAKFARLAHFSESAVVFEAVEVSDGQVRNAVRVTLTNADSGY